MLQDYEDTRLIMTGSVPQTVPYIPSYRPLLIFKIIYPE